MEDGGGREGAGGEESGEEESGCDEEESSDLVRAGAGRVVVR